MGLIPPNSRSNQVCTNDLILIEQQIHYDLWGEPRMQTVFYPVRGTNILWQMAVITGFYTWQMTWSIKLIPGQGDRGPICGNQWSSTQSSNKQKIEEPQTAGEAMDQSLPIWPGQVGIKSNRMYCIAITSKQTKTAVLGIGCWTNQDSCA